MTTAFFLNRSGISCTLVEKSHRLGGLIRTDNIQDCQLEAGPDSFIATKPSVVELARELDGLDDHIIGSNDQQRRVYIVKHDRLLQMPQGMSMMVPGNMKAALESPLFSSQTKFRFLTEIFSPRRHREEDISVQQLISDHFGYEVLEYVAEPLLSGVYGGDSAQLSAESVLPRFMGYERTYGSLIRGVRRDPRSPRQSGSLFLAFRSGMQTLTDVLSAAISGSVHVIHQEASSVEPAPSGWRVKCGSQQFEAKQLVLAVPAYVAATLLAPSAPELASELEAIPYSSAILVTVVFNKNEVRIPEGFGLLVPHRERKTIAAITFVGSKWPSRIPSQLMALRAFIVDPEAPRLLPAETEDLVQLVCADLKRLLNITAQPLFSTTERWPYSMPQYVVGHQARQERIVRRLSELRGLHLTGNAYDGVGVPDCVRRAKETAKNIAASMQRGTPSALPI